MTDFSTTHAISVHSHQPFTLWINEFTPLRRTNAVNSPSPAKILGKLLSIYVKNRQLSRTAALIRYGFSLARPGACRAGTGGAHRLPPAGRALGPCPGTGGPDGHSALDSGGMPGTCRNRAPWNQAGTGSGLPLPCVGRSGRGSSSRIPQPACSLPRSGSYRYRG